MTIGQKLQSIRLAKGISVYRLAQISEVTEHYIHAIENNKSQPSIMILEQLLNALDYTLAEFFSESNAIIISASPDEADLIHSYRALSPAKKKALLILLAESEH